MTNNSLQIIDNFLDQDEFAEMTKILLGAKFPWFYGEYVSLDPKDADTIKDPLARETSGFHHVVFDREYSAKSFSYEYLTPLFEKIETVFGYTKDHMIRARLGLKFQKPGFTSENYNLPHVDYYYPHDTLLFYLHDTDGDTRIFDQWHTYNSAAIMDLPSTFTTQSRVSPKANRLVLINGLQFHTASNPITYDKRALININYTPK
jgi:hypothetical protein